jgi:uncharacterized protein YndB with AHSA1/START domain
VLKKILLVVVLLIAGVLVYATTRPDTLHVEREVTMNAPPEKISPFLQDFRQWAAWSPYDRLDPAMTKTFSGAERGVGAVYEWAGNSQVGRGRMEITEAEPTRTTIKLDFIEPFEGHNVATFTLAPSGNSTTVTWSMDGPSPYVTKLMGVFINMDNMIGQDFQTGLESLKILAER